MEGMVPNVFPQLSKEPAWKDSLQKALQDYVSEILNEGAARKLTAKFIEVTAELPAGDTKHMRERLSGEGKDDRKVQSETDFVAGFVWWLTTNTSPEPYLTRSGMVMRAATCLKSLGCWSDLASGMT